jgi:hypothetical protein
MWFTILVVTLLAATCFGVAAIIAQPDRIAGGPIR